MIEDVRHDIQDRGAHTQDLEDGEAKGAETARPSNQSALLYIRTTGRT